MINLHESYAAKLRFELITPGSAVRHAIDCSVEPSLMENIIIKKWSVREGKPICKYVDTNAISKTDIQFIHVLVL